MDKTYDTPEEEFFIEYGKDEKGNNPCGIIEAIINKKRFNKNPENSRKCYRALITLLYIENKIGIEELYPVLDKDILENYKKTNKNPNRYEIYLNFHPKADKKTAEAEASALMNKFKKDLDAYKKNS